MLTNLCLLGMITEKAAFGIPLFFIILGLLFEGLLFRTIIKKKKPGVLRFFFIHGLIVPVLFLMHRGGPDYRQLLFGNFLFILLLVVYVVMIIYNEVVFMHVFVLRSGSKFKSVENNCGC